MLSFEKKINVQILYQTFKSQKRFSNLPVCLLSCVPKTIALYILQYAHFLMHHS